MNSTASPKSKLRKAHEAKIRSEKSSENMTNRAPTSRPLRTKNPEDFLPLVEKNLPRVEMPSYVSVPNIGEGVAKPHCLSYHYQTTKANYFEFSLMEMIYHIDKENFQTRQIISERGEQSVMRSLKPKSKADFVNSIAKRQRLVDILGYEPTRGRVGPGQGRWALNASDMEAISKIEQGKYYVTPLGVEALCKEVRGGKIALLSFKNRVAVQQKLITLVQPLPSGVKQLLETEPPLSQLKGLISDTEAKIRAHNEDIARWKARLKNRA